MCSMKLITRSLMGTTMAIIMGMEVRTPKARLLIFTRVLLVILNRLLALCVVNGAQMKLKRCAFCASRFSF